MDGKIGSQADRWMDGRQADRQMDGKTGRQAGGRMDGQMTDRWIDRQAGRQIDKERGRKTDR